MFEQEDTVIMFHVKKWDEGVLLINQDIYNIFIEKKTFLKTFFHMEIYFSGGRKENRGRKDVRGGRKDERGVRKNVEGWEKGEDYACPRPL